ncbi:MULTISPECIES: VirB8/TrbF family protein [unclassified Bartonella]|uniref:VirB8/TrbF family protein n=1 Tax=unclassified Bartonella TaxID=2645622 RepID=UPI0009994A05|nr:MULTISPECIES: VirB8/TrbF family protein [unclassified Bartonella]AQX22505.1 type IV secretion system protein VirB5 [Bartonella sp. 11B]AQX24213.1 type IV secretion system protein VirB5 [Bartonella sp. 114]AQX24954.1 type IV secretion system protein VirB5 [Bartonella sp. Coyote22sub2]
MKKTKNHEKEKSLNPYILARREWMERYGDYIQAANNWRLATFGMIIVTGMSVGAFIWKAKEQTVVPYIIQTNSVGEVAHFAKANIASKPNATHIRAALRNWLIGARTVYVDMRAEQDLIQQTYSMTLPQSPAYRMLVEYHQQNDPYSRSANETVEVQVNAVIAISDDTWQIEWTETTRARTGAVNETKNWQATATVILVTPKTEQQIMANPIGLFVKQFAWTQRL